VSENLLTEKDLTKLARRLRKKVGITRAQAARDMEVSQTSIFHAEESPEQSLSKLRARMIETYSPLKVIGPFFYLQRK
jgi:DNA-binding XRE family transcriptional regulator